MSTLPVAIIGGGISGLHTAYQLAKQGRAFQLFEAKDQFGGRIFCPQIGRHYFDLGPSWFWPGQKNIEALVKELGLSDQVFQQYSEGDAIFEPHGKPLQRGVEGISMAGANRLNGGLHVIIQALCEQIRVMAGSENLLANTKVVGLEKLSDKTVISTAGGERFDASSVIVAMPPRVAMANIEFTPALAIKRVSELNAVATWMAGHAKAVIVYPQPFWREAGLSGDVISQIGPLSEIHDASTHESSASKPSADEEPKFALFGFVGIPPKQRVRNQQDLKHAIFEQLQRVFGGLARRPTEFYLKDWAADKAVATELDQHIPNHHSVNIWHSHSDWNQRLIWSGTEAAQGHYNGYIEGALLASEQAYALLPK